MRDLYSPSEARDLRLVSTKDAAADRTYYVYLLTNWNNRVLYVGVTNNIERRVYEHKHKLVDGFTQRYRVNKLVYFESTGNIMAAIEREKQIKSWRREKKNALVEVMNPEWNDLSLEWNVHSSLRSE